MTVVAEDVRKYLNNPGSDVLDTNTVQKHLDLQTAYVNAVKKSTASSTDIDNAVLARAGWAGYIAYVAAQHKSFGEFPTAAQIQMDAYRKIADEALMLIADPAKIAETKAPVPEIVGMLPPVKSQIPSVDTTKFIFDGTSSDGTA